MSIAVMLSPYFKIALAVRLIVVSKLIIKDEKSKVMMDYVWIGAS